MAEDILKLFEKIDARLTSNQTLTSRKLARELDIAIQDIESAVHTVQKVAFHEYRKYRRLITALRSLKAKNDAMADNDRVERRSHLRVSVPHVFVRYHLYGRGVSRSRFSRRCPLRDLSMTGLAFLSDRLITPGRDISLLISGAGRKDALSLECRVVSAVAVDVTGFRYCIGIRFAPFDAEPNHNLPEDLIALAQLETPGEDDGSFTGKSTQIH